MALLTADQREAFLTLSRFDQQHHHCVYDTLRSAGHTDPDLLVAGLVHDIGKHENGKRVGFVARAAKVVLGRTAPGLLRSLAQPPASGWRAGIVLAVHHPEIGANRARALGFDERVCVLIQTHEDAESHGSTILSALQHADGAC